MEVVITTADEIGDLIADEIAVLVASTPEAVLGVATGSSPLRVYEALGRHVAAGELSLARARAFTLDEYVGLPPGHPARYDAVIREEFVARVDIDPEAVRGPDGDADDLDAACHQYEGEIRGAGGIDLQILGIGTDGHIAFNEPGSSLASRTRVKTLTAQTRLDNARFFDGDLDAVPRHCLTQGLGTILEARRVVLVATGEAKAHAVAQLVEGAVSARWPATVLQHHPDVSVFVDVAAASQLELADYYRDTRAHRSLVQ